MMAPWLGIALVLAVLGGLMAGLRIYQRLAAPHPEVVRKFLHVGMGLVTLSFPWLFDRAWPVLVLAFLSVALLTSLRLVGVLKKGLGSIVGGVARASLGEIYFPVAVAVLFLLFLRHEDWPFERRAILYCIPVLLLTLADAAAALVGVIYGRRHYETADGAKSVEGSFAFFACAFFCIHIPLLLATNTGRAETLLIALLLAWLAMMFEAVAWHGLDNLVLPLVSYLLLKIYLDMPVGLLISRVVVTVILTVFVIVFRRLSTLAGSAVVGTVLVGYIAWALGGWRWLLPPLILFLSYPFLSPRTEANSRRIHNVHAVVCVTSAGLVWLFLAVIFHRPEFLFLYTLAFAAHLAIIAIARLRFDYPTMPVHTLLAICVAQGWLLLFIPYLLAAWLGEGTITRGQLLCALAALPAVALAAVGFYFTQPGIHDCPTDTPRWLRQAAHAALGSAVGLLPLYLM
jgi:phytol kinase